MNHNIIFRRFNKVTRYFYNESIHHDLKIKPMFAEMRKHLTINFHLTTNSHPVRNSAVNAIRRFNAIVERWRNRFLVILSLDDSFILCSKKILLQLTKHIFT